jgi:DNA-binding SARP family transcriptional activator/tetratricopeptide (TPR) repeat protein
MSAAACVDLPDSDGLRVQLLGPVRAWRGDDELELGGPGRRAVLGMLAMRAGQPVMRAELIDGLWGEDPPASAVNGVHVHVAGLRRALEPGRTRRAPGQVLPAVGPGYLLRLDPGQVDVAKLGRHLALARRCGADGDLAGAAGSLDEALALWHGSALAGIPGPWADIERVRLAELRLGGIEERVGLMLAVGAHQEAVAWLAGLIHEHPLAEQLRGQLMVALYRCGRQADALAEFTAARQVLASELGIEPGPGLRRLHQQILSADPVLDLDLGLAPGRPGAAGPGPAGQSPEPARPEPDGRMPGPARPVPRQLPADADPFLGRAGELAELDRHLRAPGHPPAGGDRAAVCVVTGTAGVGKTTLAVRWAHRVRDAFPGGQLYVSLRGYDPADPMSAGDALAGFLRALGVSAREVPVDLEECAAWYRSLLHGRRMLIILDNAATVEQVRPLLPGTPDCAVIVTSRDSLAGLVAREGARRLDLDLLPPADAIALLRALVGARADADPAAAAALVRQCARLPLALRVTAELAAARPALPLDQLVAELADEQRRLDLLEAGGDPRTAVRGVFSWSCRHLPADAVRAFGLIGLHPGPDLDAHAVAALTGAPLDRARDILGLLARAHLIQPAGQGRYGQHDLLRAYAAHLSCEAENGNPGQGGSDQHAAQTRLFDYYLATAATAMDILVPVERERRPQVGPPPAVLPAIAGDAAALAWLDAERATLVAMAARTAAGGWPSHAVRLSSIVCRYVETGGHYTDAITIHGCARGAARDLGDPAAEGYALSNLGVIEIRRGRCAQAAAYLRAALALFRQAGDRSGAARALTNLAGAERRQGHYDQGTSCHQQALAEFRAIGDRVGEARVLNGLGLDNWLRGCDEEAAGHFREALTLFADLGDRSNEAHALGNLGMVIGRLGADARAVGYLQQALALLRELGNRSGAASVLTDLGVVACRQGRYADAARHQRQALAEFRAIGERTGETEALNGLGEVLLATGEPSLARARHEAALALAGQTGDQHEQARARNGLGAALLAAGLGGAARAQHEAALALAGRTGDQHEQARAEAGLRRQAALRPGAGQEACPVGAAARC